MIKRVKKAIRVSIGRRRSCHGRQCGQGCGEGEVLYTGKKFGGHFSTGQETHSCYSPMVKGTYFEINFWGKKYPPPRLLSGRQEWHKQKPVKTIPLPFVVRMNEIIRKFPLTAIKIGVLASKCG